MVGALHQVGILLLIVRGQGSSIKLCVSGPNGVIKYNCTVARVQVFGVCNDHVKYFYPINAAFV